MINDENLVLEQKLKNMDFYEDLADKERMKSNFTNKINIDGYSKKVTRRRVGYPAIIATITLLFMTTMGLTVFADDIEGLLKQIGFKGGNANQVEQLSGDYGPNVFTVSTVSGLDITDIYEGEWKYYPFESIDEARATVSFAVIEPVGLPDNWELRYVGGQSNGSEVLSTIVETIYHVPSTYTYGQKVDIDHIPRYMEMYVYQQYIGEGATLNIETTENIQNVVINGIEMLLIDSELDNWRIGGSLSWVQNGISISINPSCCTYDELIEFAERFVQ